ncbi:MAG: hypothetical protein RLZZ592_2728 [Pseudomonadota bacterium]
MKTFLRTAVCVIALSTALAPTLAEAKRLGGGGSSGMQRSLPSRSTPPAQTPPQSQPGTPAQAPMQQQALPGAAAATGAAAAGKRSWLGPLAGLAAGLGIAALLSHFGLGEAFADMMMIALLAMLAVFAVRWLMNRNRRPATGGPAWAGAGAAGQPDPGAPMQRGSHEVRWPTASSATTGLPGSAAASFAGESAAALPADFDRAGFERAARMIFIRMQAANDRADLDDLRRFTTPEMFAAIRVDLQDRRGAAQETDVVEVRAEAIDFVREDARDVVSVRYSGLIREEAGQQAAPFDEVWHLVRERGATDGTWLIAGIQQGH